MVFVWSHLTNGDPAYTLVQVSVNDLIMLVLFVPLVQFLVSGTSWLTVPFRVLLVSVVVFIVIPLIVATLLRIWLVRHHGKKWFERSLLPRFAPVTIVALLATLLLIFAFQADNITGRFFHVALIAVPITPLATAVGVLVEVPVMLSVCAACNRTRSWFPEPVQR